jgi:hypothetical protein
LLQHWQSGKLAIEEGVNHVTAGYSDNFWQAEAISEDSSNSSGISSVSAG